MNPASGKRKALSPNQLILLSAAFFTVAFNVAFFRNLAAVYAQQPWGYAHMLALGVVLYCMLVMLLALVSFRPLIKPAITGLLLVAACAAYFMDSYNVIIDRDMIVNALSTDAAETADLLSLRMLLYLTCLAALPATGLWRLRIRPESRRMALRNRLLMTVAAFTVALSVMLIANSFFVSFVREHKALRYYTNPLTPLHSFYQWSRVQLGGDHSAQGEITAIGEDAFIPPADVHHELIIMVVGETARADRFSLNGYTRETNPLLAKQDVISFNTVSSCGTSTAISVPCMFALAGRTEFSGDKASATQNALDVLEHAGVSVLWRDNNSSSKGVADRVRTEDFRSPATNPDCDVECRDEGMLAGLQDYIDEQGNADILIVLHQMGSHGPAYFKRYPERFRQFTPTCESNQLDTCSTAEINNSYDNTIVYTDYFLSRVIDLLSDNDNRYETALFYVSDHGESLGESGVYLHGLPYWLAPDSQTKVPMIFWFGQHYDDVDVNAMRQLATTPVSHDSIFHTLLGFFEIATGVYSPAMDLLQQSRDMAGTPREFPPPVPSATP